MADEFDPGVAVLPGNNTIAVMAAMAADKAYLAVGGDADVAAGLLSVIDENFGSDEFRITFATNIGIGLSARLIATAAIRLGLSDENVEKSLENYFTAIRHNYKNVAEDFRASVGGAQARALHEQQEAQQRETISEEIAG